MTQESDYFGGTNRLKKKLLEEELKLYHCENRLLINWNGKHITLELEHVNGKRTDDRLQKPRPLCPDCRARTPTYRGKNKVK